MNQKKLSLLNRKIRRIGKDKLLFFVLFALIFIRYCYYGFEYFHQLDDYIQYHNLVARTQNPFAAVVSLGLLASRPLAGIADLCLWSRLYSFMIVGVAVVSALFAASACLFRWVFSRHFGTSYLFLVVYALLPLGFEGTYWMSASTRIVVSLFFAALALYGFEKWCESGNVRMLILFALCQLLACGFYEQVLIFSVVSVLLLSALHYRAHRLRSLWGFFALLGAGAYFLFIRYFSGDAVFSGRGSIVLPVTSYYWNTAFPNVVGQLKNVFVDGGLLTLAKGFVRGAGLLFSDFNVLYVAGVLLLTALFFYFVKSSHNQMKRPVLGLVVGLILAVAPVMIFFFLDVSWFSFRGAVPSFCGLALIVDILFALLLGRRRNFSKIMAFAGSLFVLVCCIASISELHDYRETTIQDQEFVGQLADRLKSDGLMKKELSVGILNLDPTYLEDQNYYYHEHIHGVTESDWALHGALETISGYCIPDVTPVPADPMYKAWNYSTNWLGNFDALYLYRNQQLIRIFAVARKDGQFNICSADGALLGYTYEINHSGYLALDPAV